MFPELSPNVEWLEPWQRLEGPDDALVREPLVRELEKELPPQHVLRGVSVVPVARRIDCDDVLFATTDPLKPLAVVHLTYSTETDPNWPHTTLYASWSDWIERCLLPDSEEYSRYG
jgi:hypothetical protein